jgi:UDP-glucose 4-epimerase
MAKTLITGGCGFIGANLVTELERRGESDIVVFDNESLGKRENLLDFKGEFFKGDLRDCEALRQALEGVGTVVHLAAHTRVIESVEDPRSNFNENVIGTFNLLEECRRAGVKRLINASTGGAILGEAPSPVHEGLAPQPLSPYGASKLAAEGYCSAFSGSYGVKCASLRFSNIYGPRSYHKDSVVARFIKQILAGDELVIYGDGSQVRDYLYIGDLVSGIADAMRSDCVGVFQLGSGAPTTLSELLDVLRRVVGEEKFPAVRYADARPGEVHTTWCDISKARGAFGYDPSMRLPEGVKATWDWFVSDR